MKAKDFMKVLKFMSNVWTKEVAIKIWGGWLGEHFYSKWCGSCDRSGDTDHATMTLFFEMSEDNVQTMLDYINVNYHG